MTWDASQPVGCGEDESLLQDDSDRREQERLAVKMLKQRMHSMVVVALTGLSAAEVSHLKTAHNL
ncbi:hypothetical protein [Paenibacillus sp. 1P07SE]|uniref:hypothetical protein n=1 Tax=Paenibacillus sp. 1P07SE TaxID=3132209 RepID=UPI0039A40FFF